MKFRLFILGFSLLNLSMWRCSTAKKIEALKPEPSVNKEMVVVNKTSVIAMPIEVKLQEISNILNKNLKGLIYQDSILNDDKTEMKIWKTADIKLSERNNTITSEIPLKIWLKVKYGTEFLGLNDTKEINLNGVIKLNSTVKFENWKLKTTSSITDFTWSESPSVVIAGKNVPITYLVNPTVSIFKEKIAKTIDDAIAKNADFKEKLLPVLEKVSTPFMVSETYKSWFKLVPKEVQSTIANIKNETITLQLGLLCDMQTIVGQEPKNFIDFKKITTKSVPKLPTEFSATVAGIATYENASKIITENFKGQEFGEGKKKITVQKVALWQKDNKMIIALDMLGSVNGTIYLSGVPKYNAVNKEIYFDELDYVLNTKGILTKTANWLLQGYVLNKIKENCKYSLKSNLDDAKNNLLPYFNNYSPVKGVYINGSINDIIFEKMEYNQQGIVAFFNTTGIMKLKINGYE
jgi:Domain of unknown function (DUF4403)